MPELDPTHVERGARITARGIGPLTVTETYTVHGYVELDVEPGPGADIHDMDVLAAATGATSAQFLSLTPRWLYRLYFEPGDKVTTVTEG